jgi:predicted Zn-dependent protease
MHHPRLLPLALICSALLLGGCARNPVTGGHDVTVISKKSEVEQGRKQHEEVIKFYGVYEDQALQDYVNDIGQKLAHVSERPELEWHFTIVDADDINAFALAGGYIYITRGLMAYLNTEGQLAAVLGHEIGHVCRRHQVRQETQGLMTGILAMGAAIFTGSRAVADLANIGGEALLRGYGREMELEADASGAGYIAKAGYDPKAMLDVLSVLKNQEIFEVDRARQENREPQIYHGVFSTHPSADVRLQQAVGVTGVSGANGGRVGREDYMRHIEGLSYAGSRAQGIVRDNRFYHADLGVTIAFPRDWMVLNERNRLLAHTKAKDTILQIVTDKRPDKLSPREYLVKELGRVSLTAGEQLSVNGMDGYTALARSGSPLDGGAGPVRYAVLYRDKLVYIFAAASRSSLDGVPAADRIFLSTIQTLRGLKPSEFPLTEPYRIHVKVANSSTRIADLAEGSPIQKYPQQILRLMNDLYPNKEPAAGQLVKVVE